MSINSKLHNVNIERGILSSVLFFPEHMESLMARVSVDSFYMPDHQRIFGVMQFLYQNRSPPSKVAPAP